MDDRYEMLKDDPAACRQEAKKLLFSAAPTVQEQKLGIKLLTRAVKLQDAEAMYLMANQFLERKMKPLQGGYMENGLRLMEKAAELGYGPAKTYMQHSAPNPPEESFRYCAGCIYNRDLMLALLRVKMYGKSNPKKQLIIGIAVCALLFMVNILLCVLCEGMEYLTQFIGIWVLWAFAVSFKYFIAPSLRMDAIKKMQDSKREYIFTEDRLQVQFSTPSGPANSIIRYDAVREIYETDRYLFITQTSAQDLIVDKLTFNGGMPEVLREKLRSYLGKKYVRCRY